MTKLKTLKEIKLTFGSLSKEWYGDVDSRELKQEAIKWVKGMENPKDIYWMKMFFNITEEDLK